MMYYYGKISYEEAEKLGLARLRKRVADGSVIINQSDILNLEGMDLSEKIRSVGGQLLNSQQAKEEIKNKYTELNTHELIINEVDNKTDLTNTKIKEETK